MQGFIFALFEQKWQRFGWYVHYAMCVLDAAVVYLNFHALVAIKAETEEESFAWAVTEFADHFVRADAELLRNAAEEEKKKKKKPAAKKPAKKPTVQKKPAARKPRK